jgi:hypothetical protein
MNGVTTYERGSTAVLMAHFYAYEGGPLANVSSLKVRVTVVDGGEVIIPLTSVGVIHDTTGTYHYSWGIPADASAENYLVEWVATEHSTSEIITVVAVAIYLTPEEVVAWIGLTSWDDAQLQEAIDAETAAQTRRCRIPSPYPPDLRLALIRRVQRVLAMRTLPFQQEVGEQGVTFTPTNDPEVRRLENPYRKVILG